MAYGDDFEQEFTERMHRWQTARMRREVHEESMRPDDRLDEVGWEIFYCATARGVEPERAARHAMDGNYGDRLRVRDDMWERHSIVLRRRLEELQPPGANFTAFDTHAPEQLEFWGSRLSASTYVYFIQDGERGPVKIGLSKQPTQRLQKLQTGNPRELLLRHVIPGDRAVEHGLHQRFAPARIRREWFGGREYLPIILAFAGGLADRMVHSYDGSGAPTLAVGVEVRTEAEIHRIRCDIERRWLNGFLDLDIVAELLWLQREEVEEQVIEMSESTAWDIHPDVGRSIRDHRAWRRLTEQWDREDERDRHRGVI